MSDTIETRLAAPVFEDRPLTHLAGLKRRQRMSQANLVPLQWQEFTPYLGNIPGGIGRSAYGVVGNIAQIGDDYDYYSVVEVDGRHALPSDLISLDLPAQRFARFRHEGHVSTIRSTIGAIFEKWQLHPGTTSDGSFGFIEYYGPGFDPAAGLGDIEIWIAAPK